MMRTAGGFDESQYIPLAPATHVLKDFVFKDLSLVRRVDVGGCHVNIESPRYINGCRL